MPQPPKILVVESHDDTRELYAEFLRHVQFTVVAVATTDDGLQHAASADAIVTGIGVSGSMDGIEFVRRVRQHHGTARTPIIVVTANAFETYRQRAFAAGCNAFLTKPCSPDELNRELRRWLVLRRLPKPSPVRS